MEKEPARTPDKRLSRTPWNKGKLIGAKPPLRPSHVWSIRTKLQIEGKKRDLALSNFDIDSKLRGCDVVAVHVDDIAPSGYSMDRATIRQKKTGRPVRFELTDQTRIAIDDYLRVTGRQPGQFLFAGRRDNDKCGLTTRQYARLVQVWVASIGLDPTKFGTHSLRRTKAVLIYRRTGNLRAVQLLLGHSKIESTVRYLGIEVDDAIEIAEKNDIGPGADFPPTSDMLGDVIDVAEQANSMTAIGMKRREGSWAMSLSDLCLPQPTGLPPGRTHWCRDGGHR